MYLIDNSNTIYRVVRIPQIMVTPFVITYPDIVDPTHMSITSNLI